MLTSINERYTLKCLILFCSLSFIIGCNSGNDKQNMFFVNQVPKNLPFQFDPTLLPNGSIIHRGVFSNDLRQYYFTISDRSFSNFRVLVTNKAQNQWTEPVEAFFNSKYDDHGMSFSPDGNTLVFSSTRPVVSNELPKTWHIWMCKKSNQQWSKPEYIKISNLHSKLISHPTLAPNGTIYFHASNLDYSDMSIYYSSLINGKYQTAKKIEFGLNAIGYCTPYIAANGKHLVFATIGENLNLYICKKQDGHKWSNPIMLSPEINKNGQGNPYLTPDSKYLFFAREDKNTHKWSINWVSTGTFL